MSVTFVSVRRPDNTSVVKSLRLKQADNQFGTYVTASFAGYADLGYTTFAWDENEETTAVWANADATKWFKLAWVDTSDNEANPSEPIYGGASLEYTPKSVLISSLDELAEILSDKQINNSLDMASSDVRVTWTNDSLSDWEKKWLVYRGLYHAYIILANKWITKIPISKGDRRYQLDIPYKNFSIMLKDLNEAWYKEIEENVRVESGRYVQKDNTSLVASYDLLWEDLVSKTTGQDWSYYQYTGYFNVDDIDGLYIRDEYRD